MFLKSRFCHLALLITFSLGFGAATLLAQTPQGERRMVERHLPTVRFPAGKTFVEVPFEVESGLMVIPVSVNGSRPLRYAFDTGASGAIHYNAAVAASLHLKITGTRQARGVGGGGATFEVAVAENVTFDIGGIEFSNGQLSLHRSPSGLDGVIGRPVFASLVVEVDWEKQTIKFYEPANYKYSGKGTVLPLTFDAGDRPYTMATVNVAGTQAIPVKLVVDTGASHALSLDVGSHSGVALPEGLTKTVVGRGASGDVIGYAGRVKTLELGGQVLKDVPTTFPEASSSGTAGLGGRHGNLGSGVLRRFKVIYDYSRKQMIVEPNKFATDPFGTPMPKALATVEIPATALPDYIGLYGNKRISVLDGGLHYQRIGGSGAMLRAIGKDKFALNRDAQITFLRDARGVVNEMLIEWVERDKERLKREIPMSSQPSNPPPNEQMLSQAEREVRQLEREWLDAYEKRDAEAMKRILSDDFKLTQAGGAVQTKADILAALKAAQESGRPPSKFSTEDVQSRVEGEMVILTGRFVQRMERDGQIRTMQARYTDTYAKRQGRWQVIASQLTRIQ
jgi:ketosteroid isomerase-like protein